MKRFFQIIGRMVFVAVLLLVVLFGAIQTPWGKIIIAELLSEKLSRSNGMAVEIGRISGWIPMQAKVEQIEVFDDRGRWLSIENLEGHLMLSELLDDSVFLKSLQADEVRLYRRPSFGARREKRSGGGMNLQLERCSVDKLLLDEAVAGTALSCSVYSGGISIVSGALSGTLSVDGDVVGQVQLQTDSAEGRESKLMLQAQLEKLQKPLPGMENISGNVDLVASASGINASLDAHFARCGEEGTLSATMAYADDHLQLDPCLFEFAGYVLDGALELELNAQRIGIELDMQAVDGRKMKYTLSGRGVVDRSGAQWRGEIEQLNARMWDAVTLSVQGSLDPGQVALTAELEAFDVNTLPFSWASRVSGRAHGQLSIAGNPDSPTLSGGIDVSRFGTSTDALDELPKLDGSIGVELKDGLLSASTSILNFAPGYLAASAVIPCSLSILPFRFEIKPEKSDGMLDTVLDMEVFNGVAAFNNQRVSGIFSTELSWEDGVPDGKIVVGKAAYENYASGISFTDFQALFDVRADGIFVEHAAAAAGADGTVKLSGALVAGALDLELDLKHAALIHRPEAEAVLQGALTIGGAWNRPEVKGKLKVERAQLLPENMMPEKPALLENYDAAAVAGQESVVRKKCRIPVGFDVTVEMLDQMYVSASLIDSVWGGKIQLQDAPEGMSIKGRLEPKRGYVDFIGKKFRFTDGSLEMDGSVGGRPVMNNLTAEFERSDIIVRLVLNGSLSNPQVELESVPALPEDEILSQVLFNRDAGTISPYQALQIADAARQLSDGLSGPGFLYQFRQAIGVDMLEIREPESEESSSSVAAGKYLTPELYIEVSSSFGSEAQTDMSVEYEIDRHFSVETSAGANLRPGIGLNWKTDY